jgi:DNA-directed RNA polymerase subunit RPC12/RpoP
MRLRCPANKCPIDVPDDFVGARIRCPHCGTLILVEAKNGEGRSDQVQPGLPTGAPDPKEVSNLENQIYDGRPPLSVMMELRRRKGKPAYDDEELSRRYPMTEDDWKALAAFEQVLYASAALTTAFWFGLAALFGNMFFWHEALGFQRQTSDNVTLGRLLSVLASALAIPLGVFFLRAGAARLSRVRFGLVLAALPWCTLALSALFAGTALWYFTRMVSGDFGDRLGGLVVFVIAADAVAFLATAVAGIHAWIALTKIRPPEIAHRLIEALKYLA